MTASAHHSRRRVVVLVLLVAIVAATSASDFAHHRIDEVLNWVRPVMTAHPITGKVLFALLSAISAMVAFFSTAIVVPAAVYAWGDRTTFLLLWMAWLAGGCCSYVIGRSVGRGLVTWMIDKERVDYFSKRISSNADFFTILLFQLALPSEIPGYVLGAVRYPFRTYFFVLALAELPFALGAVYLGDSFVHGQYVTFIAVAAVGLMFTAFAVRRFQRHLNRQENPVAPADAAKPESK